MGTINTNGIREVSTPWSSSDSQYEFIVENPATANPVARVKGSSPEGVARAVQAANDACYEDWRWRSFTERSAILNDCARIIEENAEEIAVLESSEVGKPLTQARTDVKACVSSFRMYSAFTYSIPGGVKEDGAEVNISMLEPHGVIGAIVPFNWPPIHTAAKIAPSLAVGNGIVIKPPEQCPSAVVRIVELINTILPKNLVNTVCGLGAVGAAIASNPLVRMVSFTGSPNTGKIVLKTLAENFTPSLMELGGKNPFIIFEDADLDEAVHWAIYGAFYNQGEACTAASRLLVHSSLHDEFVSRMKQAVPKLKVGDPMDPGTHVGPVVTAAQQKRVLEYLDIGVQEGAVIAAQAPVPTKGEFAKGCWVPPTLVTGVTPNMRIAREEIFGPVTAVIQFDTYEEAIHIANDTEFGLVAGVFSKKFETCWRATKDLHCGMVLANTYNRQYNGGAAHGGCKASGYGREYVLDTLREYGQVKTLRMPTGLSEMRRWFAVTEVLGS